jgi:hypothetical protein
MKIDDNGVIRDMTVEEETKLQALRANSEAQLITLDELAVNVNNALEAIMFLSLE